MIVQTIKHTSPEKTHRSALAIIFAIFASTCTMTSFANDHPNDNESPDAEETIKPTKPDPENGRIIARALCTNCHVIGEEANTGGVSSDVPSFPAIANKSDQSAERISNWLLSAHGPMPNIHLTRKELRDLAAYIISLRKPRR
jgi:mono/diheme cytochrome c family protein